MYSLWWPLQATNALGRHNSPPVPYFMEYKNLRVRIIFVRSNWPFFHVEFKQSKRSSTIEKISEMDARSFNLQLYPHPIIILVSKCYFRVFQRIQNHWNGFVDPIDRKMTSKRPESGVKTIYSIQNAKNQLENSMIGQQKVPAFHSLSVYRFTAASRELQFSVISTPIIIF